MTGEINLFSGPFPEPRAKFAVTLRPQHRLSHFAFVLFIDGVVLKLRSRGRILLTNQGIPKQQ